MSKTSTKIFVGNLPETCRRNDLQEVFEKYGKVDECDVLKNYGFVHMTVETEAHAAIQALNNSDLLGNTITVEASRSKVRPRAGMGGKGQCFRCGKAGHWSKDCPMGPVVTSSSMRNGYGVRPDAYGGAQSSMYRERMTGRYGGTDRMRPYPEMYDRTMAPMAVPTIYDRRDAIGRPPPPPPDYMYASASPPPPMVAPRYAAGYDPYQVPPTSYPTLESTESYQSYLSVLKFVKDAGI